MRILPAALLLFYICIAVPPAWVVEEALKLPSLWQHYQEHRQTEKNTSFRHFWEQHYGKDYQAHRSAHDHSDLPGKDQHQHLQHYCGQPVLLPPALPTFTLTLAPASLERSLFSNATMLPGRSVPDIWQPPKG